MNARIIFLPSGCAFAIITLLQAGCAAPQQTVVSTPQTPITASQTPMAKKVTYTPQQAKQQILSGKVAETINSRGYTYLLLEKDGQQNWIAIPERKIEVGQTVKVRPGMQMGNFTSNSLRRTFDGIIFSAGLESETTLDMPHPLPGNNQQMPAGHPSLGTTTMSQGHPPANASMPSPEQQARINERAKSMTGTITGKVIESIDSKGYTYLNIESKNERVWVAVPFMKVSVGQELKLKGGAEMKNFSSTSLNRTFDSIIFSSGPVEK